MITRKVIEWVPRVWWVVDERPTGYTPLYKGKDKADAERWLAENPLSIDEIAAANAEVNAAEIIAQTVLANSIIDEILAEEKWNTLDNGLTPD